MTISSLASSIIIGKIVYGIQAWGGTTLENRTTKDNKPVGQNSTKAKILQNASKKHDGDIRLVKLWSTYESTYTKSSYINSVESKTNINVHPTKPF